MANRNEASTGLSGGPAGETSRRLRAEILGPIFLAVFFAVFGSEGPLRAADTPPEAYSRLYFAIQPPQNREVERSVELIEELLKSGRYGEAAPLIDRVFADPIDYLDTKGGSLRLRLQESLRQADPQGRRIVRSILAGAYQRELNDAHTVERLRRVVARYSPELFGSEALTALARAEEAAGAYANATAAWRYAQQIARQAGRRAEADRFAEAAAASALRSGQPVSDALSVDERHQLEHARAFSSLRQAPESWVGPGGDARRRSWGGGGAPHGWRAWWAKVETFAANSDRIGMSSPGGLIATGGVLLTPTPSGLIAFDAESGKRLWEAGRGRPQLPRGRLAAYERARGGIATDGRLAFVVEPTVEIDSRRHAREQGLLFTGGRSRTLPPNTLVAYELAREGKLAWRWDEGGNDRRLGKAAILGPPAVAETRLYVLADIEQSVCLVTLDAATGELLASQPLTLCERGFPPHAVTVGVTPTVGERLVYCPTGRGAVAAFNPLLRRLEWVHYLEVDKDQATPRRRSVWNGLGRSGPNENDAWKHCRVIEHNGQVVVASPALATLEVLDGATGELLWRETVEGAKYLLGVDDGQVVSLEQSAVIARDLESGEAVWRVDLPESDAPAGEALWLDRGCLLPLESGALAHIAEGQLELIRLGLNPLEQPARLGDLIAHRGAVYSRSHEAIACYRQPDGTSEIDAIDLLSEDPTAAAERLRASLLTNPGDKRIAERLAAALLSVDEAGSPVAEELERLVSGPKGEAYARHYQIEAARDAGDQAKVKTLAESLLRSRAADEAIQIEPELWTRASRVAEDRLGRISTPNRDASSLPEAHRASSWSSVRIEAKEKTLRRAKMASSMSSRRREPAVMTQRLALTNRAGAPGGLGDWLVEHRNGEPTRLIGHNRWGERVFHAEAPSESSARGRRNQQAVGQPSDAIYGEWIALRLDDGYAVYRYNDANPDAETDLAWTNRSHETEGFGAGSPGSSAEQLFAAGPWGFISISEGSLLCRDLATGRVQWRRRLGPLHTEPPRLLVSRDDLLISGLKDQGVRISAATGESRPEPWPHPPVKEWQAVCVSHDGGAHLLVERRGAGGRDYRLVSVDRPDRTLWSARCDTPTQTVNREAGLFAFLDEASRLTLLDMKRGEERFSITLPSEDDRPVRGVRILTLAGRLLVEVDRTNPMIDRAVGVSGLAGQPMLTGELHCLDPQTGKPLWSRPAQIEAMSRLPTPLHEAPALLYGRRTAPESESSSAEARLSLVVLDPATGGTLYRNHRIPAGESSDPSTRFRVQSEADGGMLIRLGRAWLSLRPTDNPAPPRPPMLAGVEDPASAEPKDVGRSVERLINSFWDEP